MPLTEVNRPVDEAMKEKDVCRKLQFYGIISALKAGKVPSNEQIDVALNSFLASRALSKTPKNLSIDGQSLLADVREVVEQAKILLLSKNQGNLVQDFIWQSQQIQIGDSTAVKAPIDTDTANKDGKQALDGIRTLGTLILSNGQFRKLLKDASIIIREIFGDSAQKAVKFVNPNEEELSQVDRPASKNTWHDIPEISVSSVKDSIKSVLKPNLSSKDSLQKAGSSIRQAKQSESSRNQSPKRIGEQKSHLNSQSETGLQIGLRESSPVTRDGVSRTTPKSSDASNAQIFDGHDRAKNYLSSKISQERLEQTKSRLRKLVLECQEHSDYQQAITTLLDLAKTYAGYIRNIGQQGASSVKVSHSDLALTQAEADLRMLIERFANGTSTKPLFETINAIYSDADRDPDLKSWLSKINIYIRNCLQRKGFIMDDVITEEWENLFNKGKFLLRERYRNHTDRFVDQIRLLADQFDQDPHNKKFAEATEKLFTDLGNDENGKASFKPPLVKDLREIILPAILENIRYVPIPRIEYSDQNIDLAIENLIIESDNFFPNIFELTNDNYFRWDRRTVSNKNKQSASLHVAGIQMDMKDVAFYIQKKKGFPAMSDIGVVDIFLGGSGFSFTIKMSTSDSGDRENFFKVNKVDVDMRNFKIKIKQSQHKLLFAIAKPILLKVIRPALQRALEQNITQSAQRLDSILFQMKLEVDRTKDDKDGQERSTNIYQRYLSVAQKKIFGSKEKSQVRASGSTVNIAATKQDSIFPNIHLPGGISSKATGYIELAQKGEKWESPVFSLGSAPASQNIPSAPSIIDKKHPAISDDHNGFLEPSTDLLSSMMIGTSEINQTRESNPRGNIPSNKTTQRSNGTTYGIRDAS